LLLLAVFQLVTPITAISCDPRHVGQWLRVFASIASKNTELTNVLYT